MYALAACINLPFAAAAQNVPRTHVSTAAPSAEEQVEDFTQTVIPLRELKSRLRPHLRIGQSFVPGLPAEMEPGIQVGADFGTAFCLDAECRFVVTNYHVAALLCPKKIEGRKVVRQYLATGPHDHDATWNSLGGEPMAYTVSRDLAIFELQKPIPHHHGLAFSFDELKHGERVDIYAYPIEGFNPFRKLLRFPATFRGKTASGILVFDYQLTQGKPLRGGASGGIVVDARSGKIVGILSETTSTLGPEADAVPVQSLADFVKKVQPFLAHHIFRSSELVSPFPGDFYPRYAPSPDVYPKYVPTHVNGLLHRSAEPEEVTLLRKKAQVLVDSMRNFIAVQSFAWGSGEKDPSVQVDFEVRVIEGGQKYRWYPEGKKELKEIPPPPLSHWILPGNDWSELPMMVGTEFQLRVHQAEDVVVNKRRMKIFQYRGSVEDGACGFERLSNYGFFVHKQKRIVSCYGEVWTDENTNILRISQTLELPRHWGNYQVVVTYGWLDRVNEPPRLIPLTFFSEWNDKKAVDWCRGQFTDYQEFSAKATLGSYK